MANEPTLMIELGPAIPFTVADAAMPKGTVCKLTDPFTAVITEAVGDPIAGIAKNEKIVDGKLAHGMYRTGIWKVYVSGSVAAGDPACTSSVANQFEKAATNEEDIAGTFLEDATTQQTCLMELKPFSVSLA